MNSQMGWPTGVHRSQSTKHTWIHKNDDDEDDDDDDDEDDNGHDDNDDDGGGGEGGGHLNSQMGRPAVADSAPKRPRF